MMPVRPKAATFQGSPCRRGHAGVRRVDNRDCVTCAAERFARFKAAKPERVAAHGRKYYDENAAVVKKSAFNWKRQNPEKVRECNAAYLQANLDKHRVNQNARRAKIRNAQGRFSAADIDALMIAQDGMCAAHCGSLLCDGFDVDHVVALAAGGSNGPENIQLLCPRCNRAKGIMPMPLFMAKRMGGENFGL